MGGIRPPETKRTSFSGGFPQAGYGDRLLPEPVDTARIEYDATSRLELNTNRLNRDGVVTEQGLVFTDFGGASSLYQSGLNTLFHRLRYWKIRKI